MFLSKATRSQNIEKDAANYELEENRLKKLSNIVLIDYIKNMSQILYNELQGKELIENIVTLRS